MTTLRLYMVLLGCKPTGRHVEQHDVFFGIGTSLKALIPDMKAFWPEAGGKLHIDAWREVTTVDTYQILVVPREPVDEGYPNEAGSRLFFINLGGYQSGKFEEQHYMMLTVKADQASAFTEAKQTGFFRHNQFAGATSHIDDKYGIDVDDLYQIEDILVADQKERYRLELVPAASPQEDVISLGYQKLSLLP